MNTTAAIARHQAAEVARNQRFVRLALADWASLSVEDREWFRREERREAARFSAAGAAW